MALIAYLHALFALDLGFLADVVMQNLLWIFMFYAAGWFFSDGKEPLKRGFILWILVSTTQDIFQLVFPFTVYTATGLALLYFLRMPVLIYFEKTPGLSKFLTQAWLGTWFVAIIIIAAGM
ncbi:Uncharacterised protein [uncultured archaeon]|nr:Uncharacterised protein [uncultured archaeon]